MKPTLQVIVVFFDAHTEFLEICSNSPSIQKNKQGRSQDEISAAIVSLTTRLFSQNSNSNGK